jgi:hypothetical protein
VDGMGPTNALTRSLIRDQMLHFVVRSFLRTLVDYGMAEWRNGGIAEWRNGGMAGAQPDVARPSERTEFRAAVCCGLELRWERGIWTISASVASAPSLDRNC